MVGVPVPSPQTASVPQLILACVWESLCCGPAGGASTLSTLSLSLVEGNLGIFTFSPLLGFPWVKKDPCDTPPPAPIHPHSGGNKVGFPFAPACFSCAFL